MIDPDATPPELLRRKPGARGRPIRLADGSDWLLPDARYHVGPGALTRPDLDAWVDRFHEQMTLGEEIALADILLVARSLLLVNYELDDEELAELLTVAAGMEAERMTGDVLAALFGAGDRSRGFTDWARVSLVANGLAGLELDPAAIQDVLMILVATGRAIPSVSFIDSCRIAADRESLEHLI